ncbi:transmembrane channel-like protein 7 [Clupea harengus]|uniref:Transmembrane channel-like protein n=1 Tax=Clupea harengus TaxID=7950 RepID=A0A6P8G639_CLUHA|nr:transmembrane channel-like protein 7 [Clupea harengus]
MVCSNTSLLFLLGITCVFVLSLVMVIRRTVIGYKHTWITGSHNKISIINKVFSGWNFCIQDDSAAALKHSLIRNELKMDLEEQGFHQRLSRRTLKQKMTLYVLRVLLNVLVLVLLAGSFCMIFFATQYSKEKKEHNVESWIVNLILGYLPAITITTANHLLPRIFQKISVFEDYSLTTQLNLTLLRSTFLKLASLGIYILFLFKMRKSDCWENEFGKQMYQLSMFDLLACFINTFLISFPAKWLRERYPSSVLARLVKPQFIITLHVLDLVYCQTVTWVGVFYCPLLPCICTLKLTAVFYMKKCCVLRCCVPAQKMVRTHSSSVLFHFMLLLGLIIAAVHLSVSLSADTTGVPCGPFSNSTVSEVVNECVGSLPHVVQSTLRHMDSKAIALPLIMVEIVILTCFVSQGRANHKTIERLNDMLVMCNSDKRFLVEEHSSGLSH